MTIDERLAALEGRAEAAEARCAVLERHILVIAARLRMRHEVRDGEGRVRGVLYWPEHEPVPPDPA